MLCTLAFQLHHALPLFVTLYQRTLNLLFFIDGASFFLGQTVGKSSQRVVYRGDTFSCRMNQLFCRFAVP